MGAQKGKRTHIQTDRHSGCEPPLCALLFFLFSFFLFLVFSSRPVWRNLGRAGGSRTKSWAEQRCNGATHHHPTTTSRDGGPSDGHRARGRWKILSRLPMCNPGGCLNFGEITGLQGNWLRQQLASICIVSCTQAHPKKKVCTCDQLYVNYVRMAKTRWNLPSNKPLKVGNRYR